MKKFLKILGPGLLYAGAAVGVSHLVQSTRAGAMFNFDLVWVLILANVLKYPFFEFGPRYAVATGNSLVDGYNKVGKWAVGLFATLTFMSMFITQAAITVVTVGLISYVFNISISLITMSIIVLLVALVILVVGKYSLLDKVIKYIIILLALSTIVAVFAALGIDKVVSPESLTDFTWTRQADVFFMIAFVGWMPAPIDVSVWSSLWNIAKTEELGYTPKLKNALTEFRVGYIGTAILALGFLSMGALVMYGTGEEFSPSGTKFSEQLIGMYTTSLGSWAYWVVSIAAIATMISTTITVLDAYSRVLSPIFKHFFPSRWDKIKNKQLITWFWLGILIIGTIVIISYAAESMGVMVNLATTISFLVAPILAWLNYKVVTDKHMPKEAVPGLFLKILAWIGMVFFVVFTFVFFYWKYF